MTNSARNQYPDYAAMAARLRAAAEQIERMQQEHGPPHLRAQAARYRALAEELQRAAEVLDSIISLCEK